MAGFLAIRCNAPVETEPLRACVSPAREEGGGGGRLNELALFFAQEKFIMTARICHTG